MSDSKKKKKGGAKRAAGGPTLREHPRAMGQIAAAKGWGGVAGFALAGYFAHGAGLPLDVVLLRAVIGGVLLMLGAWAAAVLIWRHLAIAEVAAARRTAEEHAVEMRRRADEVMRKTAERTR